MKKGAKQYCPQSVGDEISFEASMEVHEYIYNQRG